jgi:glucokinase
MHNQQAIGIDLGGTRVKGVVVDATGQILHQQYTNIENNNWKQAIETTVAKLRVFVTGSPLIGISAPGIPSAQNNCIQFMPGRLQGLEGMIWSDVFGTPTWVANDAIAAMAAEARFGTAIGVQHAIMLTLGTGVGGAILIDGKIYTGAFQKGGHLGHISLDHAGEQDITGTPGSLEDAIGNCTIAKRSEGRYQYTHELLEDVRKGDQAAMAIWDLSVKKLAIGIASLTNVLSPELVILGGGITEAGELLFEPLMQYMEQYEWRAGGHQARIVKATHGDMAGAIGAAGFAMMKQDIRN